MGSEPRLIEDRQNVLKRNDLVARALREQFRAAGVFVVSLVWSPGAGKTMFLEKTLFLLSQSHRVAALAGDLATENDATRVLFASKMWIRGGHARRIAMLSGKWVVGVMAWLCRYCFLSRTGTRGLVDATSSAPR
jgi:hypothetical protein